jgi:hypothetical protein
MKAVIQKQYGGPETLRPADIPVPVPRCKMLSNNGPQKRLCIAVVAE